MNKTGTRLLETHRLVLRRFCEEDAEDMFSNWASDPEVTRFLTWPAHQSPGVTRRVLDEWISRYEDGGYFNWAVEWKESGSVVGNISVVRQEEAIGEAEIGYCLGRAFWGKGIMPEALRAVCGYLFDTAGVNRICAGHDVNNPNSGRVMEKAGLKKEGIRRGGGKNNRGICDMACYALLRSDRTAAAPRKEGTVTARFAREEDLPRVNELRRQVNDLHVSGQPEIFRPGFCDELKNYLYVIWKDPKQKIVVAEMDHRVCGFAVLNHIIRPENPFMFERNYLDIDEFCVDENNRRQGAGSAMIRFIRDWAGKQGFRRLELNMWEFNRSALAFYEAAGFRTYRRYMEVSVSDPTMKAEGLKDDHL